MRTFPLSPAGPHLGGVAPLCCVPLMAADAEELLWQAEAIAQHDLAPDLVEWRADALPQALLSEIPHLLPQVHAALGGLPLLFTNRLRTEGGMDAWDEAARQASLQMASQSGAVRMIDLEAAMPAPERDRLLAVAHAAGVGVIISAHDFAATPDSMTLSLMFRKLLATDGDAVKYAVTAVKPHDALRLLRVTEQAAATAPVPLISLAMGSLGSITRLAGPLYGSSLSYATIAATSAPGQLPLALVREYWHATGVRA